jgi:hypothetical protein
MCYWRSSRLERLFNKGYLRGVLIKVSVKGLDVEGRECIRDAYCKPLSHETNE